MTNNTDIIALRQPETVDDPLTEIARDGARRMLAAALRAEADAFVAQHAEEVLPDGRQRVVRHGYGPERSIQTGSSRSATSLVRSDWLRPSNGFLPTARERVTMVFVVLPTALLNSSTVFSSEGVR